jgi:hypothetical protein
MAKVELHDAESMHWLSGRWEHAARWTDDRMIQPSAERADAAVTAAPGTHSVYVSRPATDRSRYLLRSEYRR